MNKRGAGGSTAEAGEQTKSCEKCASLISVINCFRIRRLSGRLLKLLGQGQVRELHSRYREFLDFGSSGVIFSFRGLRILYFWSFIGVIVCPRLRLAGSPSASGSKSSSRNSSTSMILRRRRIIGCHPNHCAKFYLTSLVFGSSGDILVYGTSSSSQQYRRCGLWGSFHPCSLKLSPSTPPR